MPEALKRSEDNPIRQLRLETWAEMLNLPAALAAPLLDDPVASADLFTRNPLGGNRFTDVAAQTNDLLLGKFSGSDSIISDAVSVFEISVTVPERQKIFDILADPTTGLESHDC